MVDKNTAPVRVAVAGCGYWGKNLVRNFAELNALCAIHDPSDEVAQAQSKAAGVPARAWAELLDDPAIDAVAIASPAVLHGALTREALNAGKHVFVEKPLALDPKEAEELCDVADSVDRRLMVGHLLQYHPAFLKLKALVTQGDLGRLQYIYSNRLNLGKVRREENILWSFAPHDISMILSLVGDAPETVDATGANYLHQVIADVTTTHMKFSNGVQAHVFVSWLHPFKEQKLVVVGDRAMAVFDDGAPWAEKFLLYPHRIDWIHGMPQPAKADAVAVELDEAEPLRLECQHFLDCVANGTTPRTDGREGVRVLKVLHAAELSMSGQSSDDGKSGASAGLAHPNVMVHESAVVDDPCSIGAGTKIWHFSHILANVRIGKDCVIGQNVMIGPDVSVGDGCKIQNNVSLYKGVTLEDGVFCGPSCVFTNVKTPRAEVERKEEFLPTTVGRGASIGANSTIVCGHDIGAYSMIAAGAVVTSAVAPHALVAGIPARRIGWVSHAGDRLGDDLVCPRTGTRYQEKGPDRLEVIEE